VEVDKNGERPFLSWNIETHWNLITARARNFAVFYPVDRFFLFWREERRHGLPGVGQRHFVEWGHA
jgi:hypothetical protein